MQSKEELLGKLTDLEKQFLRVATLDIKPRPGMSINDYREEIEKAKPSSDPSYWAKRGCKKCNGTGVDGFVATKFGTNNSNTMRHEQICACATKKWQEWQDAFVEKLRKSRLAKGEEPEQLALLPDEVEPTAETATQTDPKHARAMEQIERIAERVSQLREVVLGHEERLVNLPQKRALAKAEAALATCGSEEEELRQLGVMKERQAAQLEEEAKAYQAMAAEALRQAANLRQQKKSEVLPEVDKTAQQKVVAQQNLSRAQSDLSRAEHQVQKKIREVKKHIDRYNKRIERIRAECGLNDPVFIGESSESAADQASPTNS